MKRISILGSTGSIGTQALDLVRQHPDLYEVSALTAYSHAEQLFEQVRTFRPRMAGLVRPVPLSEIPSDLSFCHFEMGTDALRIAAAEVEADQVLVSIVGIAGLQSVMDAIHAGRQVLLANKEALVTGGHLVMDAARQSGKLLLPVDSEHSAIFQCLQGAQGNEPVRLLLTASGGPFRTWTRERIEQATCAEALNHPNWSMGAKITIDSASMFNKALEIIEAHWLFNMPHEQIQVVVHPQSVIHSAVEFRDGAVIAQLGVPDMRVPIAYAMTYPERITTGTKPLDLFSLHDLTFEKGDPVRFPALRIAGECLSQGGAACTVLNGANEVANLAFREGRIPFGGITRTVEETLSSLGPLPADTLPDIFEADRLARVRAQEIILKGI
ncbi:MAG: 1-deoxy-D-xylulose-5-phosphate reductoisomerase [Clostridiales bacterium]|nr:1-deoxy-D-xylulose-5-phosphate reductoisomerase [Clostridia bacterium]MCR4883776.1 1-deoxy-D-xylulose-5-phosphate reductoisomerase [Clostridiales bacterium]